MGHSPPSQTAKTTVTISIASPGVISLVKHGFSKNQAVVLATTGALPTGLTAGTTYYVQPIDSNTFSVAATASGAAINTSGSQSGVQTVSQPATTYRVVRLQHHVREALILATADTSVADAATAVTNLATVLADLDLVANTATNGLVAILGASVSYNSTTHQYSGTMGGNATVTPTLGAALYALINTVATAVLAAQAAVTAVQTDITGKPAAIAAVKATAKALRPEQWIQRRIHQDPATEDIFEVDVISSDDGA